MKERLIHNIDLKILSLALAFFVWLVVLSIEDPTYTREFTDITVTEVNGDQITEAGKAYTYIGSETVSVKVKGKTSILNRLTREDFLAIVDLSKLSITGAVTADVSCPKYPSVEITPIGTSTVLNIEIENLVQKSLNVRVVTNGSIADGYYTATGIATPNMITISGPESEVSRVSEAVVNVNISSANVSDITTNKRLELLDEHKDTVSSSTLSISQSNIDVTIPIYKTKTLPINFGVTGQVADDYRIVSIAYEPKVITVAGRDEDLAKINEITLRDYDISGANSKIEASLSINDNLADKLPEGVVFEDKEATVALVADIQKIVNESFELPLSKISLKGSNTDYSYTKTTTKSTDKAVTINIKGTSGEINALTVDDLAATVDVEGYGIGEYDLPVNVILNGNLEQTGELTVHIVIANAN